MLRELGIFNEELIFNYCVVGKSFATYSMANGIDKKIEQMYDVAKIQNHKIVPLQLWSLWQASRV